MNSARDLADRFDDRRVLVAADRDALKLSLFPRRVIPTFAWAGLCSAGVASALVVFARPDEALAAAIGAIGTLVLALFTMLTPYRATFRLDRDMLTCVGAPDLPVSRLALPLDEIESIRAVSLGRRAHVAFLRRDGTLSLARVWGMRDDDATLVAARLREQLEALRARRPATADVDPA